VLIVIHRTSSLALQSTLPQNSFSDKTSELSPRLYPICFTLRLPLHLKPNRQQVRQDPSPSLKPLPIPSALLRATHSSSLLVHTNTLDTIGVLQSVMKLLGPDLTFSKVSWVVLFRYVFLVQLLTYTESFVTNFVCYSTFYLPETILLSQI
jgi:hypothetical protein